MEDKINIQDKKEDEEETEKRNEPAAEPEHDYLQAINDLTKEYAAAVEYCHRKFKGDEAMEIAVYLQHICEQINVEHKNCTDPLSSGNPEESWDKLKEHAVKSYERGLRLPYVRKHSFETSMMASMNRTGKQHGIVTMFEQLAEETEKSEQMKADMSFHTSTTEQSENLSPQKTPEQCAERIVWLEQQLDSDQLSAEDEQKYTAQLNGLREHLSTLNHKKTDSDEIQAGM